MPWDFNFISRYQDVIAPYLGAIMAASLVMALFGLFAAPIIIANLPADYYRAENKKGVHFAPFAKLETNGIRYWIWWPLIIAKNAIGAMLLVAGIAMLVLPGQGLLTILLGIALLDFPKKRQLEVWIVHRPAIMKSIDWIRKRVGKEPMRWF